MVKDTPDNKNKNSPKPKSFLEWLFYPYTVSGSSSDSGYIRGVYGFY